MLRSGHGVVGLAALLIVGCAAEPPTFGDGAADPAFRPPVGDGGWAVAGLTESAVAWVRTPATREAAGHQVVVTVTNLRGEPGPGGARSFRLTEEVDCRRGRHRTRDIAAFDALGGGGRLISAGNPREGWRQPERAAVSGRVVAIACGREPAGE